MIEAVEVPVRSRVFTEQDAKQAYELLTGENPQSVKFGEYDSESKARTQGQALDRLINAKYGQRFGVSVWQDEAGKFIGALRPKPPVQRTKGGRRKK